MSTFRLFPLVLGCLLPALRASADAIVVTRAMSASTIAEMFVEEGTIRVDLEIGAQDLEAFRNVLPDDVYQYLGFGSEPRLERSRSFLTQDWVVRADGGTPIPGRIVSVEPRPRVRRDEITGEPLGTDDTDGEIVVFAELVYELPETPKVLSFAPPRRAGTDIAAANIGFVAYHRGLPVNDFRYLGTEEILDLDWTDPWYSQFRNRNLRRQFSAPIQAFLYVDAFEVRKEIIARPKDLQHWIDLGLEGRDTIPAGDQAALKEKVAEFLVARNRVTIDGRAVEPILDRIHFVRRSLRTTGVIDPPEDLPVVSATLGVIFVYLVTGLPQEVAMEWELFSDRISQVPAVATDEAGGLPGAVTPDDPVLRWENFLKNPSKRSLVELAPPPEPVIVFVPVLSVVCAGIAVALATRRSRTALATGLALLVVAAVLWPYGRASLPVEGRVSVADADARTIVTGLLSNVYHAFDYRDEDTIYDTLARSASGELLTQVYLETRRALELQNQGGARARVNAVEVVDARTEPLDDAVGFTSRCTWNVAGSVGHWGHIHQRRNRYEAMLTVKAVDGAWKVTELELLSEERL